MLWYVLSFLTALAALGAALALRAAKRPFVRLWRVLRAQGNDFTSLSLGEVALRGKVVPIDPLISEETSRQGVYLAYTADRWERSGTIGHLSGQWMRTEQDAEAAPFELTDGHTAVLIDPQGAEVIAPPKTQQLSQPDGTVVRYQETLIEDGAEVLILGRAAPAGGFDPSSGYRGHTLRLLVQGGTKEPLLIACRQGLARQLALQALLRIAGVLPLLLLFRLLVHLQ